MVFYKKSGATAIAVRPHRKKTNIQARNAFDRDDASVNSFQIKTPQHAEIMVAPWPIEYDTAGPTMCACDATKFAIAPVHQIAPPTTPHKCQLPGACQYPLIEAGARPSSGIRISK